MLVASIREKKNNYYINLNQKDNEYEWQVVCANNSKTYTLEEEEAKSIINKMFDSNLTYLRKEKDYTIYLDEANNKRYFKNNQEDFVQFFLKNGEEAILFNEEKSEEKRITNLLNRAKRFIIKKQDNIVSYYSIFLLFALFTSNVVKEVNNSRNIIEMLCKYNPKIEKDLNSESLSYNDITNYINQSNDKLLTEDKRKYLTNINLFNDVLEVADLSRCYSLRKRLNNIGIKYFTEEEKKNNPNWMGYYNVAFPNLIHLKDDSKAIWNDNVSHEFMHLLQDDNQYTYIREASAEILAYEYYKNDPTAYKEAITRVYILMEMIGPQPIFECNFKGNTSTFEDKIHEVLEEKDANRLLELFTKSPAYDKEKEQTNQEIDELLAKMYQNIYGRDISSDKFIQHIYKEDSLERYYFNTSSRKYNEDYQYFDKEELDYDSVMQSDTLKFVNKYSISITKDEFLKEIKKKNINIKMKPGKIGEALKEETKQEGMFKLGKMITVKYISRDEYYKVKPTYYDSLEEYQKEHDKTSIVDCFYQGKKIKYYQRYGKEKKPSFVYTRAMREPSIRKKFPNQFNNRTKNIDFSEEIDKMLIQDYSSRKNNESSSIFLPKGK